MYIHFSIYIGSALMGSLQILCFSTEGLCWALPLTYFDLSNSARAHLSPQPVKIHHFRSGPITPSPPTKSFPTKSP